MKTSAYFEYLSSLTNPTVNIVLHKGSNRALKFKDSFEKF